MSLSRREAQRLNSDSINTEHILLAILQEGGGVAAKVLVLMAGDARHIREEVEKLITVNPAPPEFPGAPPFSPRAKRSLELAAESAADLGHPVVSTEHLLIGLVQEKEGIAARVLANLRLDLHALRDKLIEIMRQNPSAGEAPSPDPAPSPMAFEPALLDRPVFQASILSALCDGRSVALTGARGVGKTSLLKSLAR